MDEVKRVFVKAGARLNNRTENGHQATRERERRVDAFGSPSARRDSCRALVRSTGTSLYRKQLCERFAAQVALYRACPESVRCVRKPTSSAPLHCRQFNVAEFGRELARRPVGRTVSTGMPGHHALHGHNDTACFKCYVPRVSNGKNGAA
ncbi:hypothetical protein Bxe_C1105 [Paraburkholderia xenovorans LB400]|uniref:Transposase n=1 Tax=Paraburkholderia xenovorans (strain LB400) TaxID=266265 RepID=Q13G18_PARXL|nr:hypothetical protein Bxe_C1105 [Paraburkholderia xenovorans LB400]